MTANRWLRYAWIGVAAGVVLIATMLRDSQAQTQPSAGDKAALTPVVVIATIDPFWAADLYAKVSGYVAEVQADIGDHVKKGQILAVIDDPELQQQLIGAKAGLAVRQEQVKAADSTILQASAAIEVAKSQLAGLQADFALAQITLKRQEELFAGKAVTNQQLDEIRAKADVASAAVDVGKAKLAAAEADSRSAEANRAVAAAQVDVAAAEIQRLEALLEYTKIVAPFDGVVTRRAVNPGDLTQASAENRAATLFTCQRLDVLRVFCEVPEINAVTVQVGDQADVQLTGAGGRVVHGKITRISGSVSPQSRTMRTEIDLDNPDEKLLPGTYAQVTIVPGTAALHH